ncbi:hypothetical protein ACLMJK_005887 [Lecanora helva]
MASHVVVLDASARRAVVKTNPGKHLYDVLQEACSKLGADPNCHGLKYYADPSVRLTGLSSGAKLQLVALSRSPSVVSVALQLPESENQGSNRLTDKVPSTTTLWLLLRKFESSSTASSPPRNFTARAIPQVEGGESGQGRLFYETPVIHVMGRELVLFTDLQKTLSQLGFNSGSVLLRLSFRKTQTPLEEAISDIDQYFKSVEGESTGGAHAADVSNATSAPGISNTILGQGAEDQPALPEPRTPSPQSRLPPFSLETENTNLEISASDQTVTGPSQRPITVFAPPSTSTPAAAREAYNEKDYEPTIDHAKSHQSRLAASGRNRTLPSDAELVAQAEAEAKKKADIKTVNIKIRFPDQATVIAEFSNIETSQHLYEHVKGLLESESEPFSLNFITAKGPHKIPQDDSVRLITGLGLSGNVLVNLIWEAGASSNARSGPVLKENYRQQATEIKVQGPKELDVEEKENTPGPRKQPKKGGGIPKWLKLPGKK